MNSNTASIIASVFTALATIVIGYVGYSVKADSERTVEAIRSQTALQQSLINSQYQARQLDIEMVKLALNILGGDISDKTNQSRQFAVQVLQRYSGVELKDEVVAEWVKTGTVAFKLPDQGLSTTVWGNQAAGVIGGMGAGAAAAAAASRVYEQLLRTPEGMSPNPDPTPQNLRKQ